LWSYFRSTRREGEGKGRGEDLVIVGYEPFIFMFFQ